MIFHTDPGMAITFRTLYAGLAGESGHIIQLEQSTDGANRQDMIGLDKAIEVAPEGTPVVMLGFMPAHMIINRRPEEWFAVMGYPNVIHLRLPVMPSNLRDNIRMIGSRQADPLAIALLGATRENTAVQILHHDIPSDRSDTQRMTKWEARARAMFGDLPQEALVSMAKEAMAGRQEGKFTGRIFPDVCVDIEDTLFTSDGKFHPEIIALAEEIASGGPVTLWTGGNIHDLTKKVRDAGVLYKIVSKHVMRGANVRTVIDNLPAPVFQDVVGVGYKEYIQI